MKQRFSERKGFKEPLTVIQKYGMSEELRNSLWNVLDLLVWGRDRFLWTQYGDPEIWDFSKVLWFQYFKQPIDSRPDRPDKLLDPPAITSAEEGRAGGSLPEGV